MGALIPVRGPMAGEQGQNVSTVAGGGAAQDLSVHDVQVSQQPMFTPSGIQQTWVVRYFVGSHGPFVHQYATATLDQAQVQSDIQATVQSIAAVTAPRPEFQPTNFGPPHPSGRPFGGPMVVSGGVTVMADDEASARAQFAAVRPGWTITYVTDGGPVQSYGQQVGNVDSMGNAIAGTHTDLRHYWFVHSVQGG